MKFKCHLVLVLCFVCQVKRATMHAISFVAGNIDKRPPLYTYCASNYYGYNCKRKCKCGNLKLFECDDGPYGSGRCFCIYGQEKLCKTKKIQYIKYIYSNYSNSKGNNNNPMSISKLQFENKLLKFSYSDTTHTRRSRQVHNATITHINPLPFLNPSKFKIVALDKYIANTIGLEYEPNKEVNKNILKNELIGTILMNKKFTNYYAHNYGGHQFGSWAGQLGDGRALSLGEVLTNIGNNITYELAIKGAGRTPYSRSGDGRAVFQSVAREFLGGIALRGLNIPSIGALAIVGTTTDNIDDGIFRDEYYNGKNKMVPPGILLRVGPSFLRIGNVQIANERIGFDGVLRLVKYALKKINELETTNLVDYGKYGAGGKLSMEAMLQGISPIDQSVCFFQKYPLNSNADSSNCEIENTNTKNILQCFLNKFSSRLASLIASWNSNGFVHGVMNTDNISLLGLTIDLNVFGFIGKYDLKWTPNHIDDEGRYRFGNQKDIGEWDLTRLIDILTGIGNLESSKYQNHKGNKKQKRNSLGSNGNDFIPWLKPADTIKNTTIQNYRNTYKKCFLLQMIMRLGLKSTIMRNTDNNGIEKRPAIIVKLWLAWLKKSNADYPRASRLLAEVGIDQFYYHMMANNKVEMGKILRKFTQVTGASYMGNYELKMFFKALCGYIIDNNNGSANKTKLNKSYTSNVIIAWRNQIRQSNPKYVFRTGVIRRIIQSMIQNDMQDTKKYFKVIRLLQNPYDLNEWNIDEELQRMKVEANHISNNDNLHHVYDPRRLASKNKSIGNDSYKVSVERQLSNLEINVEEGLKTSCGGQ